MSCVRAGPLWTPAALPHRVRPKVIRALHTFIYPCLCIRKNTKSTCACPSERSIHRWKACINNHNNNQPWATANYLYIYICFGIISFLNSDWIRRNSKRPKIMPPKSSCIPLLQYNKLGLVAAVRTEYSPRNYTRLRNQSKCCKLPMIGNITLIFVKHEIPAIHACTCRGVERTRANSLFHNKNKLYLFINTIPPIHRISGKKVINEPFQCIGYLS